MILDRIKETQETTAYPDSASIHQALLKVWNESSQEIKQAKLDAYKLGFEHAVAALSAANQKVQEGEL